MLMTDKIFSTMNHKSVSFQLQTTKNMYKKIKYYILKVKTKHIKIGRTLTITNTYLGC